MIKYFNDEKVFHIQTMNTSYCLKILPSNHLGSLHYGEKISLDSNYKSLELKHGLEVGSQIIYEKDDKTFNLNTAFLEMPTFGKGDFREPMVHIRNFDGSRLNDFHYVNYEILADKPSFSPLPEARNDNTETLMIELRDQVFNLKIKMYYSSFYEEDVITRRIVLSNDSDKEIMIEKILSMNLDLVNDDYHLTTFDGAWINERQINSQKINPGIIKIDSKKGVSSSDHNPFVVIHQEKTTENSGDCYGFSFIYSGNFEANIERNPFSILRVQMGINSFDFYWQLKPREEFVTPEVALTFSNQGFNGLSLRFHKLIDKHIIKPDFSNKERPVLFNNWEATMFDFNQGKILS
jgi:alpha-galactosidase